MERGILKEKELQALRFIRNQIMYGGQSPSVRMLMKHLGYRSPRAAAYILERLEAKNFIDRQGRGKIRIKRDLPQSNMNAETVDVPLVGCAPCSIPITAEENIEGTLPVSTHLARPPYQYFLLRAMGDSMTEVGINEGSLILVRKQPTANRGDVVVALIDGETTVKEYRPTKNAIVLKPRSKNKQHRRIILTQDFLILGTVVTVIDDS